MTACQTNKQHKKRSNGQEIQTTLQMTWQQRTTDVDGVYNIKKKSSSSKYGSPSLGTLLLARTSQVQTRWKRQILLNCHAYF